MNLTNARHYIANDSPQDAFWIWKTKFNSPERVLKVLKRAVPFSVFCGKHSIKYRLLGKWTSAFYSSLRKESFKIYTLFSIPAVIAFLFIHKYKCFHVIIVSDEELKYHATIYTLLFTWKEEDVSEFSYLNFVELNCLL